MKIVFQKSIFFFFGHGLKCTCSIRMMLLEKMCLNKINVDLGALLLTWGRATRQPRFLDEN